eukprot:XP_020409116.1 uncharacterized protein LOC100383485 isoform X3 [Zea mays]
MVQHDLVALVEMAEAAECEEEQDLFADANDDVGIAGSEVADGEVHPPHHAQLQQPDEMVQHGNELPSDLIDTLLKWIPSNDEELRLRLSSRSTATPHASVAASASAPVSHTAPWLGKFIASEPFNVGGFDWAIYFYPDGKSGEDGMLK